MEYSVVWDDAHLFLAAARHGTLSGTASALGMGVATVSRRLARLERALAIPLFTHHQTGYQLTEDGRALLAHAEVLEQSMHAFIQFAQHQQEHITGTVRLATAKNLANPLIIPSLPDLLAQHPALNVEILTATATVNLHQRDADLAVRLHQPESGNVVIKRLGTLGFGLYASLSYMQSRSVGLSAPVGEGDALIGWAAAHSHLPMAQWLASMKQPGQPFQIACNSLSSQLAAAQAGLGLAVLPHFLARPVHLMRLSPEAGVEQPIWLVIHANLARSRRVRAVADHLIALFEANQQLLQYGSA